MSRYVKDKISVSQVGWKVLSYLHKDKPAEFMPEKSESAIIKTLAKSPQGRKMKMWIIDSLYWRELYLKGLAFSCVDE